MFERILCIQNMTFTFCLEFQNAMKTLILIPVCRQNGFGICPLIQITTNKQKWIMQEREETDRDIDKDRDREK